VHHPTFNALLWARLVEVSYLECGSTGNFSDVIRS
jgi:hypothetical protein